MPLVLIDRWLKKKGGSENNFLCNLNQVNGIEKGVLLEVFKFLISLLHLSLLTG
jgi:hypothetical protein